MRDLAFAMIWMVLFPVALWSAHIGVLLWIWVALMSPNEQLYGFMSGVPFNKLVAAITVLVLMFSREKKQFYLDPTIAAILLLAAVATIAAIASIVPTDDGWDLYQKLLKEFALAILITGVMWNRYRIHMTVMVVCIALGFIGVVEGLEYLLSGGSHIIAGTGAIGDNNSIALALLMIVPMLFYLMRYSAMKSVRVVLGAVMAICLLILGAFLLFNTKRRGPMLLLIGVAAIGILMFAPPEWFSRIDTIQDAGDSSSFMGRVVAWKVSTLIAMDRPLLGGGFHAVQRFPVWLKYITELPSLDFIPTPDPDPYPHAAHSIYFEILGDFGFVGLATFLFILAATLYNCFWVVRQTRFLPSLYWAGDLARMLQVSLIVFLVSGALLSMAYYEGLWILVAIVSRLRHTVKLALAAEAGAVVAAGQASARERVPVAARMLLDGRARSV
jgi:probable O-glycosylation ligase (exosortase A-associated)